MYSMRLAPDQFSRVAPATPPFLRWHGILSERVPACRRGWPCAKLTYCRTTEQVGQTRLRKADGWQNVRSTVPFGSQGSTPLVWVSPAAWRGRPAFATMLRWRQDNLLCYSLTPGTPACRGRRGARGRGEGVVSTLGMEVGLVRSEHADS